MGRGKVSLWNVEPSVTPVKGHRDNSKGSNIGMDMDIIVWVVWISVVIGSRIGSLAALGTHHSILNKSDPTNGIGVCKMIFPDFGRLPINSSLRDEVRFPPQRDQFFFRHVQFNI